MKKKSVRSTSSSKKNDISAWNFIILMTIAFVLLVLVAVFLKNNSTYESAEARRLCPKIETLPRPEDCNGGVWKYGRDGQGCRVFVCEPQEDMRHMPDNNGKKPTPSIQITIPAPNETSYPGAEL